MSDLGAEDGRSIPRRRAPGSAKFALLLFAAAGCVLGTSFLVPGTMAGAASAWLAVFALSVLTRLFRPTRAAFFIFGLGVQATVFYWLAPIIGYYGGYSPLTAWGFHCCYLIFAALQLLFAGALYNSLSRTALQSLGLALPCSWVAAEVLFPGLIPWMLGHTQIPLQQLAMVADIVGVPLISFLMLWWSELLCLCMLPRIGSSEQPRAFSKAFVAATLCISIGCVLVYSRWRDFLLREEIERTPSLHVAVVQPNFVALQDFKPEKRESIIGIYRTLSSPFVIAGGLDLLVWPESSVWNNYSSDLSGVTSGSPDDPFPGLNIPLLFGGQASIRSNDVHEKPLLHNSAYLLAPGGSFSGKYHKQRLFPFSELVPLGAWFPELDTLIERRYRVVPGEKATKGLLLPVQSKGNAAISLAVAICYEDMWSDILREQVLGGGATILTALSNDAWFLKTPAAAQHHLLARWRAVELRRYLVRATVDGVSAILDPYGQAIAQITPYTRGGFSSAEVRALDTMSTFARIGPLPLQILAILLCLYAAVAQRRRR